jgi:hypothetical protein
MKTDVQFQPGYDFWVPRVREYPYKSSILNDGKEYYRYESRLESFVSHKIVKRVEITITEKSTQVKYMGVDYQRQEDDFPKRYLPEDMRFTTEESAKEFAKNWQETHGKEYFGSHHHDDDDDPEE